MDRLRAAWAAYERLLRIDTAAPRWDLMRARATYVVSWLFAGTQIANLPLMTYSYGRWTIDHTTSVVATALMLGATFGLRYRKEPLLYAVGYAVFLLLGLAMVSLPGRVGIDTALLPYLVMSPIVVAFMAGWRSALAFAFVAVGLIVFLLPFTGPPGGGLVTLTVQQEQRAFQAILVLGLATGVSCLLSAAAQQALEGLEAAIARARAAEAAKAAFLACMSHELRTPMNGVLGLTESVLRAEDDPLSDRQRRLLDTAYDAGANLLTVLNDVLDLAKLEAEGVQLEERPYDPGALADAVAATFAPLSAEKGVALDVERTGDLPPCLRGDEHRVRQVVTNLVSNAIKFTEAGRVTIRVGAASSEEGACGERIVFAVTDTGCGVPEDRRDAIFVPFEQAEAGTTRRFGGTGLGLAICRRLAERMGGTVALTRTGPDGSTFALTLPAVRAIPAAAPAAPEAAQDLTGLRVLVAEDNAVNRMVVAEFLRTLGVAPTFAEDGAQALEALAAVPFDLVLMDKHMPNMDGVAAVRAIRAADAPWSAVPVVALTADTMPGEREALLAAGMDGFAAKPIRLAELRAAIIDALTRREPARATGSGA